MPMSNNNGIEAATMLKTYMNMKEMKDTAVSPTRPIENSNNDIYFSSYYFKTSSGPTIPNIGKTYSSNTSNNLDKNTKEKQYPLTARIKSPNNKSEYDKLQEINDLLFKKLIPDEDDEKTTKTFNKIIARTTEHSAYSSPHNAQKPVLAFKKLRQNYITEPNNELNDITKPIKIKEELSELRKYLDQKYEQRTTGRTLSINSLQKNDSKVLQKPSEFTQPLKTDTIDSNEMTLSKLHTGTRQFYDEFFSSTYFLLFAMIKNRKDNLSKKDNIQIEDEENFEQNLENVKKSIREKLRKTTARSSSICTQPGRLSVPGEPVRLRTRTRTSQQNYTNENLTQGILKESAKNKNIKVEVIKKKKSYKSPATKLKNPTTEIMKLALNSKRNTTVKKKAISKLYFYLL